MPGHEFVKLSVMQMQSTPLDCKMRTLLYIYLRISCENQKTFLSTGIELNRKICDLRLGCHPKMFFLCHIQHCITNRTHWK